MKKIGILTFHHALGNYGAQLQAYALKSYLQQSGRQVHILNYQVPPKPFSIKKVIKQMIKIFFVPIQKRIQSKFIPFRDTYLIDTPPIPHTQLASTYNQYDVLISGSDQVLNPRLTKFDPNYFFASEDATQKHFSYAASFGLQLKDLTENERQFIQKNLIHFNRVSVREKQGAEIVTALSNHVPQIHLDPTFLLSRATWEKLAKPTQQTGYVLLYLMYNDKKIVHFAKKLAKQKNLKLLFIFQYLDLRHIVWAKYITPTPQEWLGLFLNASYIVTNSFHGLAFSINFNKDFFLGKLPPTWPVNSRLESLLDLTGLQDRLYTNFMDHFEEPINWPRVNEIIRQERQKAQNYLQEITK